jgi:hypothetical protein
MTIDTDDALVVGAVTASSTVTTPSRAARTSPRLVPDLGKDVPLDHGVESTPG